MKSWHQTLMVLLVLVSCIGCDQASKDLAQARLRDAAPVTLLGDALHLIYAENTGVAFSFGADLSDPVRFWIFIVMPGLLLGGLFVFVLLRRRLTRLELLAYPLVLGGGMSNLIDRLVHDGRVIDFMMIQAGTLHTAIFNLADVTILTGVGLLAIHFWRGSRKQSGVHRPAPADA